MQETIATMITRQALTEIAKARNEELDEALVQQLLELCNCNDWEGKVKQPKFLAFVYELARLCKVHCITLSTSRHDGLDVWDADPVNGPIHCCGIEDRTKP